MAEPELKQHMLPAAMKDNSNITERNEDMGDNGPKRTMPEKLWNEMVEWQNKIDAVQLQFLLATKNAQDAMQPYMEHMKTELGHAKELWQELENASASGWQDRQARIIICFKFMRLSHEKTKHHFRRDENRHIEKHQTNRPIKKCKLQIKGAFCKTKIFVQNQGMREILPQAYN
ncbi:MAG: hypothetical protein WBW79_11300 [Desulfocapsaceae bacterium]